MSDAKLKLAGREIQMVSNVTTIGRTAENTVALADDVNISRFHAEIERRGDDYYLIDLNSSNGTSVNGQKVDGEVRIESGDRLLFGGTSAVDFVIGDSTPAESEKETEKKDGSATSASGGSGSSTGLSGGGGGGTGDGAVPASSSSTFKVAAVVCGVAVVCAVGAGAFYYMGGSKCEAKAVITSPETGDTIKTPTEIEVDIEDSECVAVAVYTIDGEEVAKPKEPPFSATIDPKQFPEFADGGEHNLQLVLYDSNGEAISQAKTVELAFETRAVVKPEATPLVTQGNTQVPKSTSGQIGLRQIQEMSLALVKEFPPGTYSYNFSNQEFLREIQKRTGEYTQEGYSQRAEVYRNQINLAFSQQGMDASLGYVLAMSRSKFTPTKQGDNEGLWLMPNAMVAEIGYNGTCTNKSLSEPSQECAAIAAAAYLRDLVALFQGDPAYCAAVFGKTSQDAVAWKANLPAKRDDIWNTIKTPQEREQVARFFAAGIVALNPQKFGLAKDKSLAELYAVTK